MIDTRLVVNSLTASPRDAHENNVIGTMNILAACTGADSPVRKFVFKSSANYYGSEQDDPAFFTERMLRPHPPPSMIERDIVEAEEAVADFAHKRPEVTAVAALRARARTGRRHEFHPHVRAAARADGFGFDPRLQPVHEDDIVHALEHATLSSIPGVYNVAGDGVLALWR